MLFKVYTEIILNTKHFNIDKNDVYKNYLSKALIINHFTDLNLFYSSVCKVQFLYFFAK